MGHLIDYRGNCMSVIFTVLFSQYEALINCAYKNRGGIEGHLSQVLRLEYGSA